MVISKYNTYFLLLFIKKEYGVLCERYFEVAFY